MYPKVVGHNKDHHIKVEIGLNQIEMVIAFVILGVCAVVVIFSFGGIASQGAVAACKADATTVETAVREFNAEVGGTSTIVTPALLTSTPSHLLKSFPSSPNYAISIVSGVVMIAAPKTSTPVAYGTASACARAGA
jgi:Tfp pilus assembly protein PilE